MNDKNRDNEDDETPVEFHKERDIFGMEIQKNDFQKREDQFSESKGEEIHQHEQVAQPDTRYSEYQSVGSFCLLCLLSLNIYLFFWFYKHWLYLRDERKLDISPGARALLTLFYGYSLFTNFRKLAREKGYKGSPPLLFLFLLYISPLLTIYVKENILIIPALLSFLVLIPVLNMMNFYYSKENATIREGVSRDEKIFLVIVWVIFILIILIPN